jgi:hypothetical protein
VDGAWWARLDSNQRTVGYEPNALPLSYEPVAAVVTRRLRHGKALAVSGLEPWRRPFVRFHERDRWPIDAHGVIAIADQPSRS